MKSTGVLFKSRLVRAILNGEKTQTRRLIRPQPTNGWAFETPPALGRITSKHPKQGMFGAFVRRGLGTGFPESDLIPSPYGGPGDQIWVRETFAAHWMFNDVPPSAARSDPCDMRRSDNRWYAADPDNALGSNGASSSLRGKWRPSIHMPKWASRITLEIVSVRVERLQDISEQDAMAEGITCENVIVGANCNRGVHCEETADRYFHGGDDCPEDGYESAYEAFRAIWISACGEQSWGSNPWVWAIAFKRIGQ